MEMRVTAAANALVAAEARASAQVYEL
jgi:hypothetical protein